MPFHGKKLAARERRREYWRVLIVPLLSDELFAASALEEMTTSISLGYGFGIHLVTSFFILTWPGVVCLLAVAVI